MAAQEKTAQEKLMQAAQAIDEALALLDARTERCRCCNALRGLNFTEWKVHGMLANTPDKIRNAARRLDDVDDERHVAAKEEE